MPKSATRLYKIWIGMKQRCYNKNCRIYHKYGGRGICIYDKWLNSFEEFKNWSMLNGYNDLLTIDRINPDGNYCPDNCRWATYEQQNTHLRTLKTNTSGYTGVSWSKKEKKWICVISINNKSHRIGCYNNQKDAVFARNKFIDDNSLCHKKNEYIGEKNV